MTKAGHGDFRIRKEVAGDHMRATLRELKESMQRRTSGAPILETRKWLTRAISGYFADQAVPTNAPALAEARHHINMLWHQQLSCPSQRVHVVWT